MAASGEREMLGKTAGPEVAASVAGRQKGSSRGRRRSKGTEEEVRGIQSSSLPSPCQISTRKCKGRVRATQSQGRGDHSRVERRANQPIGSGLAGEPPPAGDYALPDRAR